MNRLDWLALAFGAVSAGWAFAGNIALAVILVALGLIAEWYAWPRA